MYYFVGFGVTSRLWVEGSFSSVSPQGSIIFLESQVDTPSESMTKNARNKHIHKENPILGLVMMRHSMYSMVDSLIMGYAALRALLRFLIAGANLNRQGTLINIAP